MNDKIIDLLRQTKIEIAPETFVLVSLSHENYLRLLENPELSPRGTAPFMLLSDKYETTMLLDTVDWQTMRHAARDAKMENNFRLLTFTIELDWDVVGFLALVAKILAEANVSVGAISAFSRDHLLIKQEDLPRALKALGIFVEELC
ncbi:MAG: ACT domain-containing protein [Acidobacteriota bacterium]|nr:ACT domain-containing protein [Acidobacteriota bacterium]